jgi:hypothetical protein
METVPSTQYTPYCLEKFRIPQNSLALENSVSSPFNMFWPLCSSVISTDAGGATFKGTVSRDGYFFEDLNMLIRTFCVCDDGFQDISLSFSLSYTIINFLFV